MLIRHLEATYRVYRLLVKQYLAAFLANNTADAGQLHTIVISGISL